MGEIDMKRLLVAVLFTTLLGGLTQANAQWGMIGMYADMQAEDNTIDVLPFFPVDIYFLAQVYDINAITAAEFSVPDFPEDVGYPHGTVMLSWSTGLVIGNIYWGIALAWEYPQEGPMIYLGTATVLDFGGYMFNDYEMCVEASNSSGLRVVVDEEFNIHDVLGDCCILDGGTAVQDNTWGGLKSLY